MSKKRGGRGSGDERREAVTGDTITQISVRLPLRDKNALARMAIRTGKARQTLVIEWIRANATDEDYRE